MIAPEQQAQQNEKIGKEPASKKVKLTTADIADGESVPVPGKTHVMKNVGGVYSCTCSGWKFQSKKIDARTCKHLQEYCGTVAEQKRLGTVTEGSAAATSKKQQKSSSTEGSKGLFEASNLMLAHAWDVDKHVPTDYGESNISISTYSFQCCKIALSSAFVFLSFYFVTSVWSEKLDGMRALWNGHQLVSRQGNPIDAPDFFIAGFPADMCLDGELFAGRAQFQHTVSIARRQNGGELWRELKFVVFDAPCNPGGFEERLAAVVEAEFLVLHPHEPCRSAEHLQEELKRIEALGGEGLMMRRKQSAYKFGRSQVLLKVKTFKDDEAIVYGHQPGKGKHSGRMGALQCRLKGGVEFKVGTGFSDQERGNPPSIGAVITFRYFELTNAGVPRFPTFVRIRPDVNASAFV
jgi:DNA ligase-1